MTARNGVECGTTTAGVRSAKVAPGSEENRLLAHGPDRAQACLQVPTVRRAACRRGKNVCCFTKNSCSVGRLIAMQCGAVQSSAAAQRSACEQRVGQSVHHRRDQMHVQTLPAAPRGVVQAKPHCCCISSAGCASCQLAVDPNATACRWWPAGRS